MRWIAVGVTVATACAAACLDIPPPPDTGGGGPAHLRHQHIVHDFDGDGFDDLVTWGSDNATGASTINVRWGASGRPLTALPDASLAPIVNTSAARYEVLDVDEFDANGDANDDLVVVWGEDLSPRDGDSQDPTNRTLYLGYFAGQGTQNFADVVHGQPITGEPGLRGGYADRPRPVFVAGRQRGSGSPSRQIIFGTETELYYTDVSDADGTLAVREAIAFDAQGHSPDAIVPIDGVRADAPITSDLLIATTGYIYRTTGEPSAGSEWSTADLDLGGVTDQRELVFANDIDGEDYALVTDESAVLTIVRADENRSPQALDRYTLSLAGRPYAVAMSELANPRVSIAALDEVTQGERQLEVFFDVTFSVTPDTEAMFQTQTAYAVDGPYDDVAVGNFDGPNEAIYLISTTDPVGHPPICLEVTGDDTLQDCMY